MFNASTSAREYVTGQFSACGWNSTTLRWSVSCEEQQSKLRPANIWTQIYLDIGRHVRICPCEGLADSSPVFPYDSPTYRDSCTYIAPKHTLLQSTINHNPSFVHDQGQLQP